MRSKSRGVRERLDRGCQNRSQQKGPLFSSVGKDDRLGKKAMSRFDSRLISKTAVPSSARTLANHGSPRTTKLYDRTREELSADEIGRIRI